jgi:WD40 repeat protein
MHTDAVRSISLSSAGTELYSTGDDGTVRVFSLKSLDSKPIILKTQNFGSKGFRCINSDKAGKYVFAGAGEGEILIWSTSNYSEKPLVISAHLGIVYAVESDSKSIFSVGADGILCKSSMITNSASEKLFKANERLTCLNLNDEQNKIVFSGEKGIIYLYDLTSMKLISQIQTSEGKILSVNFMDENQVVVGCASGKVVFINFSENKQQEIFAHTSGVNDVLFNREKHELITCGYDGTIKIWNTNDLNAEPVTLLTSSAWIYCLAYNPEKTEIYAGSADKMIYIYTIDTEIMRQALKKKIKGRLSEANRVKYIGPDIPDNPYTE